LAGGSWQEAVGRRQLAGGSWQGQEARKVIFLLHGFYWFFLTSTLFKNFYESLLKPLIMLQDKISIAVGFSQLTINCR